jgi:hypothetical protein
MLYSRSVSIKERYNSQKTIHISFCLKSDRLKVNAANGLAQRVLNDFFLQNATFLDPKKSRFSESTKRFFVCVLYPHFFFNFLPLRLRRYIRLL